MDVLSSVDPTQSGAPDALRPSFFELVAQEQLRDLLAPALRFVVATLAQRHPRALLRVANRFDEVYALAMYAVERHYLKTWGEWAVGAALALRPLRGAADVR
jgi:peroxin-12